MIDTQSQEDKLEEETIYTKNISYKRFNNNERFFHNYSWEEKWTFAEKFMDNRRKYFAAKHIFKNAPECLPNKIFKHHCLFSLPLLICCILLAKINSLFLLLQFYH